VERRELNKAVFAAIDVLGPKQGEAFSMYELEGLNYRTIAATLGCSEGSVKSRIFRARERLRELLHDERPTPF
jgi:RNA polymerase sigma-70 factor (ECF subfamily)